MFLEQGFAKVPHCTRAFHTRLLDRERGFLCTNQRDERDVFCFYSSAFKVPRRCFALLTTNKQTKWTRACFHNPAGWWKTRFCALFIFPQLVCISWMGTSNEITELAWLMWCHTQVHGTIVICLKLTRFHVKSIKTIWNSFWAIDTT